MKKNTVLNDDAFEFLIKDIPEVREFAMKHFPFIKTDLNSDELRDRLFYLYNTCTNRDISLLLAKKIFSVIFSNLYEYGNKIYEEIIKYPITEFLWQDISSIKYIPNVINIIERKIHQNINPKDTSQIRQTFVEIMRIKDSQDIKRIGGRVGGDCGSIFDSVVNKSCPSPILLKVNESVMMVGGSTRMYAAYAGKVNISVLLIS